MRSAKSIIIKLILEAIANVTFIVRVRNRGDLELVNTQRYS